MYVVSQAVSLWSIEIIESGSVYVVSQAVSLESINVERMSGLVFLSWSLPTIEL